MCGVCSQRGHRREGPPEPQKRSTHGLAQALCWPLRTRVRNPYFRCVAPHNLIRACRRSALSGSSERSTEKEELKRREKEAKEKEKEAKEKEKERKRAEKGTSGGEIRTFLRMIGKGLHSEPSNSGSPSP